MLAALLLTCSAFVLAFKPHPHQRKHSRSSFSIFKTFIRDWFDAASEEAGLSASPAAGLTTGWIVVLSVVGGIFLAILTWVGYKYSQWASRNTRSKEGYRALAQAKAATSSNAPSEVESPTSPYQGGFFASIRGTSST